jgi:hypothetical protein
MGENLSVDEIHLMLDSPDRSHYLQTCSRPFSSRTNFTTIIVAVCVARLQTTVPRVFHLIRAYETSHLRGRDMNFFRSVKARLVERFIFNFRLTPENLAKFLPAPWLQPQVVNGWSVLSFCILKLDQTTLRWLPSFFGYPTISCAYRCGVIDTSDGEPQPAVYVTDRNTDLPIISRTAPFLLADTILMVRPQITERDGGCDVDVKYLDKQRLFAGKARPAKTPGQLISEVFKSVDEFKSFIHNGVTSYAPSIFGDQLTQIDLHKEDPVYEPLDAEVDFSALDGVWQDAGLSFDSAVRAAGGEYVWIYRGLRTAAS